MKFKLSLLAIVALTSQAAAQGLWSSGPGNPTNGKSSGQWKTAANTQPAITGKYWTWPSVQPTATVKPNLGTEMPFMPMVSAAATSFSVFQMDVATASHSTTTMLSITDLGSVSSSALPSSSTTSSRHGSSKIHFSSDEHFFSYSRFPSSSFHQPPSHKSNITDWHRKPSTKPSYQSSYNHQHSWSLHSSFTSLPVRPHHGNWSSHSSSNRITGSSQTSTTSALWILTTAVPAYTPSMSATESARPFEELMESSSYTSTTPPSSSTITMSAIPWTSVQADTSSTTSYSSSYDDTTSAPACGRSSANHTRTHAASTWVAFQGEGATQKPTSTTKPHWRPLNHSISIHTPLFPNSSDSAFPSSFNGALWAHHSDLSSWHHNSTATYWSTTSAQALNPTLISSGSVTTVANTGSPTSIPVNLQTAEQTGKGAVATFTGEANNATVSLWSVVGAVILAVAFFA